MDENPYKSPEASRQPRKIDWRMHPVNVMFIAVLVLLSISGAAKSHPRIMIGLACGMAVYSIWLLRRRMQSYRSGEQPD